MTASGVCPTALSSTKIRRPGAVPVVFTRPAPSGSSDADALAEADDAAELAADAAASADEPLLLAAGGGTDADASVGARTLVDLASGTTNGLGGLGGDGRAATMLEAGDARRAFVHRR